MQVDAFKRIVRTFSDPGQDIVFEGKKFIIQVNGLLIEKEISHQLGEVYVTDEGEPPVNATRWIVDNLANLPLLATRLLDTVPEQIHFVAPQAKLLRSLEVDPNALEKSSSNASNSVNEFLEGTSPLESSILYITSNAGEGKTTLINQLARHQAERFKRRESSYLIVPIPLGGRNFLRFDDITVGALQNRYRFPYLYYDSFIELARMGLIVPAFDGFEEMFVENSSGEALSAMGILVDALESKGSLIIAARRAYFEFENLRSQERLFDTIRSHDVGFGKLDLERWGESQFIEYCSKRGLDNASKIYETVASRLERNHPLLTRPVLVKPLIDIALESESLSDFVINIKASGSDFLNVFICSIIEREANEKWLDTSGEVGNPLLSIDEHCKLLGMIALEMWKTKFDYLKRDILEFVADLFCDEERKDPYQTDQIRERIRGHALLIASSNAPNSVEFDHLEFEQFFLGDALARLISTNDDVSQNSLIEAFRKGIMSPPILDALLKSLERSSPSKRINHAKCLIDLCTLDRPTSYTHLNSSFLITYLLQDSSEEIVELHNISFSNDAFRDRNLSNLKFINCQFGIVNLENAKLENCSFVNCSFVQLDIFRNTQLDGSELIESKVDSIGFPETTQSIWDPPQIHKKLKFLGLHIPNGNTANKEDKETHKTIDEELQLVVKLLRYFVRSTHMSDSVMKIKMSDRANFFFDNVLPKLIEKQILVEIENRGSSSQKRFKLGMNLSKLNRMAEKSKGDFVKFLEAERI